MNALRRYGPPVLAGAAVLGGLLYNALARPSAPVPHWIATAALLLGAAWWWPRARTELKRLPTSGWTRLEPWAPYLAVGALCAWALWPLPLGALPVSQDHAQHYLAHRIFIDDLLSQGHLFGWTHRVSIGLPYGDVYPTGTYLVTAAPHLLSFGLVSVKASYGLGVFIAWLVSAWVIVAWARRLLGGVAGAWLGAALAGAFFVLDVGGSRQGGWYYSMFLGVWPQLWATGLWLGTMLAALRLAERQTVARLSVLVLVCGYGFWAHAFNAFNLLVAAAVLVPLCLLQRPEDPEARHDARLGAVWMVLGFGLAALIGLGWMKRLIDLDSEFTVLKTASWGDLEDRVLALLAGQPFDHQAALVGLAALAGLAMVLARRRLVDLVTLVALVGLLVLTGQDLMAWSGVGLHEEHKLIMYRRFSMTLKPLVYALAGAGAVGLVAGGRAWLRARPEPSRPLFARPLTLVMVAPLAWSAWAGGGGVVDGPVARVLTAERAEVSDAIRDLTRILRAEAQRLGPNRPWRVASDHVPRDFGHYELFAIADAGFGYLPTVPPPCQAYKHINARRTERGWKWVGASLVISPDKKKYDEATPLARVGRYHVLRLQDAPTWPAEMQRGPGQVSVESWTDHEIRLRVRGAGSRSRALVGLPPFPKWSATLAGAPVELAEQRHRSGYMATAIEVPRDGELVLRHVEPEEQASALRTALVIVGLAFLGLFAVRVPLPAWPPPRHRPKLVLAAWLLGGLLVAKVAWGMYRGGQEGLESRWLDERPGEIVEVMHFRRPDGFAHDPREYCVRPWSRNPRVECDARALQPALHVGAQEEQLLPACLRFGVPDRGVSELTWRVPAGTTHLAGKLHGYSKKRRPKGELHIGDVERPLRARGPKFELPTRGAGVVRLRVDGLASTEFLCLELVALRR